jgi:AcrR family transcriptional regulator
MARRPALPGIDRREQILASALDVFAEQGFEGATTKEIAQRADVTQGLIYFYFDSKEDLFFATIEHQARQALAELDFTREKASDEPPAIVLRRMVARMVDVLSSPRSASLARIARHAEAYGGHHWKCGPTAHMQIGAVAQRISGELAEYLETQSARGAVRPLDAALAAQLMTGAVVTLIVRRGLMGETPTHLTRDQLVDAITDLFLRGLLPTPVAASSPAPDLAPIG